MMPPRLLLKTSNHNQKHKCELAPGSATISGGLTFDQDLGDFRVAGAEGTVELEAVSVVQKGSPQREQHFLERMRKGTVVHLPPQLEASLVQQGT